MFTYLFECYDQGEDTRMSQGLILETRSYSQFGPLSLETLS